MMEEFTRRLKEKVVPIVTSWELNNELLRIRD
jgi:hypothetical protein